MGCTILYEKIKNILPKRNTSRYHTISSSNTQSRNNFLNISSFNISFDNIKNIPHKFQKINGTENKSIENSLLKKSLRDKFNKNSETKSLQKLPRKILSKKKKPYFCELEEFSLIDEEREANKNTGKKKDSANIKINFDTISQFRPIKKKFSKEVINEEDINYVANEFINSIFIDVLSKISKLNEKLDESEGEI